uniref:Putative secreted peptide n=1 Tax=Anopheles braziliensis TaxID=58242 RepID=A0A2M3ZQZ9_9DIPT
MVDGAGCSWFLWCPCLLFPLVTADNRRAFLLLLLLSLSAPRQRSLLAPSNAKSPKKDTETPSSWSSPWSPCNLFRRGRL